MPTAAIITGLSAGWLAATGAAVALPVLAHLLARRGGRLADFPAVRFVLMAASAHAKRNRLRDAILLALRMLAIALLGLAFDRPIWIGPAAAAAEHEHEWVVIVDASASMTRAQNGRTRFDAARDQAAEALRGLDPAHDRAALIIASGTPWAALPRMTGNIGALLAALSSTQATLERGDIAGALNLARSLPGAPGEAAASNRQVIVFTDLQRTAWEGVTPPAGCALTLRPIGESETNNLALADPQITPSRPVAGREARVTTRVLNYGAAARTITVSFDAPDTHLEQTAQVAPNAEVTVSFPLIFPRPAQAGITLSIADQPFTADDRAFLVADVRPARRIGIITASREGDFRAGAAFLAAALRPAEHSEFDPVMVRPAGLSRADLDPFDGVILCDAGAPDDATLAALAGYIRAGGGAAWLIDSSAAHDALARFAAGETAVPVLPADAGGFVELDSAEAATLAAADFQSPLLRAFEGAPGEALLRTTFTRIAPSPLSPRAASTITLATGEPLIAWSPMGQGRLVVFQADISPASSSLVKSPLFPVLAQELARFIEPSASLVRPVTVGAPIVVRSATTDEPAQPITDSLKRLARVTRAPAATTDAGWLLALPPAPSPGLLELRDRAGAILARAATNFDPAESDPRAADPDELAAKLAHSGSAATVSNAASSLADRRAIELWPALIAAALLVLGLEAAVGALDGPRAASLSFEAKPVGVGA